MSSRPQLLHAQTWRRGMKTVRVVVICSHSKQYRGQNDII